MKTRLLFYSAIFVFLFNCWAAKAVSYRAFHVKGTINYSTNNFIGLIDTAAKLPPPSLHLLLYRDTIYHDGTTVLLDTAAKDSLDKEDVLHKPWTTAIIATITPDNNYLGVDARNIKNKRITIPLYVNTVADSIYTISVDSSSVLMNTNYRVWLRDHFMGDSIDIAHNNYQFRVDLTKPETIGSKRFDLVIVQTPPPATILAFSGKLNADNKGVLDWQTSNYYPGVTYQLQRGTDTATFTNVAGAYIPADSAVNNAYEYIDTAMNTGKNYYRLIQTDLFGNKIISSTILLNSGITATIKPVKGFMLYPNPVITDSFSILSERAYTGKIKLTVYASNSAIVLTDAFTQLSGTVPIMENVSQLKPGVYVAEIKVDNTIVCGLKFIK